MNQHGTRTQRAAQATHTTRFFVFFAFLLRAPCATAIGNVKLRDRRVRRENFSTVCRPAPAPAAGRPPPPRAARPAPPPPAPLSTQSVSPPFESRRDLPPGVNTNAVAHCLATERHTHTVFRFMCRATHT